jgi:signal transduction histidine kinase
MKAELLPQVIRAATLPQLLPAYALLHGALAFAGLASMMPGTFAPVFWPATGLLVAACVACRRRQRLGLLAAAVIGELAAGAIHSGITEHGIGFFLTLYFAIAHAAILGASATMVEHWWQVPAPASLLKLARASGVVALVLLGGIAAAFAGPAWYLDTPYVALMPNVLAAHILGAIAVTPVILGWWMSLIGYRGSAPGSRKEFLILVGFALFALGAVFAWSSQSVLNPVYLLFPILLWAAMRFPPRWVSLLGLGVTSAAMTLAILERAPLAAGAETAASTLLSLQLYLIALLIAALWISVANYERRRLENSLREYARALSAADERARRNTAADLHDGVCQELFGISLILGAARKRTDDIQAADAMAAALTGLAGITELTRRMVEELDPPWIRTVGLPRMIDWLVKRTFDRAGLRIEVRDHGVPADLGVEERVLLFRCLRELVQNVVRHAGVNTATLEMQVVGDALHIVVEDQGKGFDIRFETTGHVGSGFGLFSVREQLASHGAHLKIRAAPGKGCAVTIVWPTTAVAAASHSTSDGIEQPES